MESVTIGKATLFLGDNLEGMRGTADKAFDLAIVDPPYGIGVGLMNMGSGKGKRCSKIENRKWTPKAWDSSPPPPEYFAELFRVSKQQIIWRANNFSLPQSQYFAVWDKGEGMRGRSFAEGELAWVSDGGTRITSLNPVDKDRIHPTQKPVRLYSWLLKNYARPGMRLIDTHLGSGSSVIACLEAGYSVTAYEVEPDYFWPACERIERAMQQLSLFQGQSVPEERQEQVPLALFG